MTTKQERFPYNCLYPAVEETCCKVNHITARLVITSGSFSVTDYPYNLRVGLPRVRAGGG